MEAFLENIFKFFIGNGLRYFLMAGIPFLIFYVLKSDYFKSSKIQQRVGKSKQFLNEIKHSFTTLAVIAVAINVLLFSPIREWTAIYTNIETYPIWWIPVSIVLSLIIHDTYFYWMHRTVHRKSIYKYIHKVHHLSINPSPWAAYSFDFLEAILENLIIFILVFSLPMHPLALLGFGLISFMINVYGHLGYEIAPRWFRHSFLFEIVNTSVYHNLHHHKFHGNYSLYFRFWDRLMGTENPDYIKSYDEIQTRRFGEYDLKKASKPSFNLWVLLIPVFAFSFTAAPPSTTPNIIGTWAAQGEFSEDRGLVEIYKDEENKYHGVLIAAANEEKQAQLEQAKAEKGGKTVFILKDFVQKKSNRWTGGMLFVPKRRKHVRGTLELLPSGNLKVKGSYFGFSQSVIWERVQDEREW